MKSDPENVLQLAAATTAVVNFQQQMIKNMVEAAKRQLQSIDNQMSTGWLSLTEKEKEMLLKQRDNARGNVKEAEEHLAVAVRVVTELQSWTKELLAAKDAEDVKDMADGFMQDMQDTDDTSVKSEKAES